MANKNAEAARAKNKVNCCAKSCSCGSSVIISDDDDSTAKLPAVEDEDEEVII